MLQRIYEAISKQQLVNARFLIDPNPIIQSGFSWLLFVHCLQEPNPNQVFFILAPRAPTVLISRVDNVTYTLIDNVVANVIPYEESAIAIQTNNIVLDGSR